MVAGTDLQAVLRASERVAKRLQPLVDNQMLGGFESAARYLPSEATQQQRRASLPDSAELRARLKAAVAALPDARRAARTVRSDVARARAAPLIGVADLEHTSFAAAFDALGIASGRPMGRALAAVCGQADRTGIRQRVLDKVRAALAAAAPEEALLLNLKQESDALYSSYLSEALRLSLAGFAAIIVLLLATLRSPMRVARVVAPLVLAVLAVAAALQLAGRSLTILHLIGMLLIVAVGSNYALFFDRNSSAQHAATAPLTLASLLIANAATVFGFGVLAFSNVPVLAALGLHGRAGGVAGIGVCRCDEPPDAAAARGG